jgi:hypothetical protein
LAAEITPNYFTIEEINGMINAIVLLIENEKNTEVLGSSIDAMTNLIPHSRSICEKFV